ncbi:MAG TPA: SulP family inorganic anion transporter [Burkholderiaceae bacterium]|jgi:SulP family sulfate permease
MSQYKFTFHPRLIDALKGYNSERLIQDTIAGVTVGIVALPLAMAFAIASGVKPEAGIFTAIIAGFFISALGGSRVQIGGPAGAFIVVIYGIIAKYGLANLLICTIFAGMFLFAMGAFRLGSVIRYIPVPIVIGFTNGIAVLIALSQIKDFFGLQIAKMPGDFFEQVVVLFKHAFTGDIFTIALASSSLLIIFIWPKLFRIKTVSTSPLNEEKYHPIFRFLRAIPGSVLVLVIGTVIVSIFHLPVETIGTKFGGIPQGLPEFSVPVFSWGLVKQLFAPTLTIALLSAIESLLCARVADNIINDRHDPNQELMALGVANFFTPFFGGLPSTGTIARTITNIRTGATSPVAGIVHALTLLAVILAAAPLAKNIPLATLAAILMHVAFNMGEWHEFPRLKKFTNSYRILVVGTFLLTVMIDLTTAVEVGIVLACVFFIIRISELTTIEAIKPGNLPQPLPHGVAAYSIYGSLFFGAVDKLEGLLNPQAIPAKVLILELHQLIKLDPTGLDALEGIHKSLKRQGSHLLLSGLSRQPLNLMQETGFINRLGAKHCFENLQEAISYARTLAV